MAKQTIGIGSAANDGTGSTLRAAFDICNDNFTELYDGSGGLLHKIEGTNFTGSLLVGHSTTGTLNNAFYNTGLGINALDALTTGDYNIAIGYNSGTILTTGERNVLIGALAGDALSDGGRNVAIGHFALSSETAYGKNVAVGYTALFAQNAGADAYNVAVGHEAGLSITTGIYNTILGGLAGDALTTGNSNIAIGLNALGGEDTGHDSVAIGRSALLSQNYDGSAYNVAIGRDAGRLVDTGIKNTIIGGLAGDNLTTGSNNILIGYDATASAVGVSNEVTIGDSNISTVRIPSDSTLKIGASGDLQLEHLSSNSFIKNTAVGDLYIENQVDSGDVIFRSDDGSGGLATYFYLNGGDTNTNFQLATLHPDNVKAKFGNSADLNIFHDSSNSYLENKVGNLILRQEADDADILFKCDDGSGGDTTYFKLDGSSTDIQYFKDLLLADNVKANFGNSADLQIYHNGTNSVIDNITGDLFIRQFTDDGDIKFQSDDGSGGTAEYFRVDGGLEQTVVSKNFRFDDNVQAMFGSGIDLRIYHDGTTSNIQNNTGNLSIINHTDDGDIKFFSDDGSGGVAEYFKLDGGEVETLFSKTTHHSDNIQARFGDAGDLRLYHDGSSSHIENQTSNLTITNYADDGDIIFRSDDGSGGHTEYFRVDGGISSMIGSVDLLMAIDGNGGKLKFGASQDLEIYHDGSDNFYNGTTGDMYFINKADDKDIVFQSDDGSGGYTTYFHVDGGTVKSIFSKPVQFIDSTKLFIGSSNDLEIFHDSSNTYLENYTGNFIFTQALDDGDMIFKCDNGSGGATEYFRLDGSDADGTYTYTRRPDGGVATFGNDQDLRIWHEPSNNSSYIRNYTNDFYIENLSDDKDILFRCDDGSGGVAEYFRLDGALGYTVTSKHILFNDSVKARFGNSADLEIYHDGSNSYVDQTGTGDLIIRTSGTGDDIFVRAIDDVFIQPKNGDAGLYVFGDGAVELYYDGNKKLETTSTGTKTTGQMDIAALNSAPSSASDTGTVGEIRFTADYIYVCVASNTWKRAALSSW